MYFEKMTRKGSQVIATFMMVIRRAQSDPGGKKGICKDQMQSGK